MQREFASNDYMQVSGEESGGIIALLLGSIVRTLLIIKSTNELVELINDPGLSN